MNVLLVFQCIFLLISEFVDECHHTLVLQDLSQRVINVLLMFQRIFLLSRRMDSLLVQWLMCVLNAACFGRPVEDLVMRMTFALKLSLMSVKKKKNGFS